MSWIWSDGFFNWIAIYSLMVAVGMLYLADFVWRTTALNAKVVALGAAVLLVGFLTVLSQLI